MLNNQNIPYYNNSLKNENQVIFTKIPIDKIENIINNILDKNNNKIRMNVNEVEFEKYNYYINLDEFYWSISLNLSINNIEIIQKTAFEINIYKDELNNSVIKISDEINNPSEYEGLEWDDLYYDIQKILK
jgi:hypothetical protein